MNRPQLVPPTDWRVVVIEDDLGRFRVGFWSGNRYALHFKVHPTREDAEADAVELRKGYVQRGARSSEDPIQP